ncbi:MAG: AAA family ATPase [Deltaproteobacteria bacterium]|jgi:uncharacterized protein YhaN|nr:AAA family ATPase [Deltaproteobacteria bacterium]
MLIRSLRLEQFGILRDLEIRDLARGLNVFLGNNEAGKTTLLKFFRAMFFGYKRGSLNLDYGRSGGKLAGGSLEIELGQGSRLTLSRSPGRDGGPVRLDAVSLPSQGRAERDIKPGDLLGGYNAALYDQIFCFSLSELSSLEGMEAPQVSAALHAAAFGTGFTSPWTVQKKIDERRKALFASGSAAFKPAVNKILIRLAEIKASLRADPEMEQYNRLLLEQREAGKTLALLEEKAAGLRLEEGRAKALLRVWDYWTQLRDCEAGLSLSPRPEGEFGEDGGKALEALLAELEERKTGLALKLSLRDKALEALRRGGEYLACSRVWPACQDLQARKGSLLKALSDLPRLEKKLAQLRLEQEEAVSGLGPDWDEEKAVNFSDSLSMRGELSRYGQELKEAGDECARAGAEKERLDKELAEAEAAASGLRLRLGQPAEEGAVFRASPGGEKAELYSPSARAGLEQLGREKELALEGLREAAERLKQTEEAAAGLKERKTRLEVELAALRDRLFPPPKKQALRDLLKKLEALRELQAERRKELASLELRRAARKPPLFGPSTVLRDKRRLPGLLLCAAAAVFLPLHERALFPLSPFFAWAAVYWLHPRAATLFLYAFAPEPLALELDETKKKLSLLEEEEGLLLEELGGLLGRPQEGEARAFPEILSGLEEVLREQDALRGRELALEESLEAEKRDLFRAEEESRLARSAALEAGQKLEQALLLWSGAMKVYSLLPDSSPESALKIFDAASLAAGRARKAEECASRLRAAGARREKARADWTSWLERWGFTPEFEPDDVRSALILLEGIRKRRPALLEAEEEIGAGQREISFFATELGALRAQAFPDSPGSCPEDSRELPALFDHLYNASSNAREETLRLEQKREQLESLEAEIAGAEELLRLREADLAALLEQGRAADARDYRLRFDKYSRHMRLLLERERLGSLLRQAAALDLPEGRGKLWESPEDFFSALRGSARETLEERARNLGESLKETEELEKKQHMRLGEIKRGLEVLGGGESNAALSFEESSLKEELKILAGRWAVHVLADGFIREARRSFEEDRQDSVLHLAGKNLALLTGGRYGQLLLSPEDKGFKVFAVSRAGGRLDSEEALSRGTREQVYLALRLAFIQQHNLSGESLPLILDDILVNFDPERLEYAAGLLADFSAGNQCLFFTCHPPTAALLRRLAPQGAFHRLEKGRIFRENA